MNFAELPTWFWIAAAVVLYLLASKKGWLKQDPAANKSSAAPTPTTAAQVVELRHVMSPNGTPAVDAPAEDLTETRRVEFGFDVAVTPVAKPKGPTSP